ncbi:CaiB/BaiF CoA transferase family protein [Rhodococcus sp. 24CO]|uniref:CaiB/BaiF CoA transferase family protein n=1 Tax=Rhodococcus sp. 24CO TaxID=3117460 RepID=UPI003D3254CE
MNLTELQPLKGVRVLSLAQQLPGPYAGMLLRELGADVILVEQTTGGDPARAVAPFFESVNRGKRSIALDLKSPQGAEAFRRLAATSRVVLEGFRPGVAARLGVDFDAIRAIREDVVYCSISGYGQDVAERLVPGHDISYQARAAGLTPSSQHEEGEGYPVADLSAAMFAALAVTCALHRSDPLYFDLSLADSVLAWKIPQLALEWRTGGKGGVAAQQPAYGLFRTRDGWVSLSVMHEDHFWAALCAALGLDDIARLSAQRRQLQVHELREKIAAAILPCRTRDLIDLLVPAGVPVGLVNNAQSVLDDPLFRQRGIVVGTPGEEVARTPLGRELQTVETAPRHGADSTAILLDLGYTSEEVTALIDMGVVTTATVAF